LSLCGEDGYPYGIPLHYVIIDKSIYFHCSVDGGHKIDAIKNNTKVSFTVIETEDGVKAKSVIIFGKIIETPDERQLVLEKLVEKFVPEIAWEQAKLNIPFAYKNTLAFKIECAHISGKWIDKPEGR
ncbi:MAG: pyridoxamine 5'-phosphate oxidase family protein, partial [Coprobacillus sp.]